MVASLGPGSVSSVAWQAGIRSALNRECHGRSIVSIALCGAAGKERDPTPRPHQISSYLARRS